MCVLLQNSKLWGFQALVNSDWRFPKGRLKALVFAGGENSAVFRPVWLSSAGGGTQEPAGSCLITAASQESAKEKQGTAESSPLPGGTLSRVRAEEEGVRWACSWCAG